MESKDKTYSLQYVEALAPHRKPGFVAGVLRIGKVEGGTVTLTSEQRFAIRRQFMPDNQTGIQFHPDKTFVQSRTMPTDGPGGMLHKLISACGFKPGPQCGCAKFARKMNEWGWLGCLTTHRQEIVDWLVAQAKKSGVELSSETVLGLVMALLKQISGSDKGDHNG